MKPRQVFSLLLGAILALSWASRLAAPGRKSCGVEACKFADFIYPESTVYKNYRDISEIAALHLGKYVTGESPQAVVEWYKKRFAMCCNEKKPLGDSLHLDDGYMRVAVSDACKEVTVHDYRTTTDHRRPVFAWIATIVCTERGSQYIFTVGVTRADGETQTHIALSWFAK